MTRRSVKNHGSMWSARYGEVSALIKVVVYAGNGRLQNENSERFKVFWSLLAVCVRVCVYVCVCACACAFVRVRAFFESSRTQIDQYSSYNFLLIFSSSNSFLKKRYVRRVHSFKNILNRYTEAEACSSEIEYCVLGGPFLILTSANTKILAWKLSQRE